MPGTAYRARKRAASSGHVTFTRMMFPSLASPWLTSTSLNKKAVDNHVCNSMMNLLPKGSLVFSYQTNLNCPKKKKKNTGKHFSIPVCDPMEGYPPDRGVKVEVIEASLGATQSLEWQWVTMMESREKEIMDE